MEMSKANGEKIPPMPEEMLRPLRLEEESARRRAADYLSRVTRLNARIEAKGRLKERLYELATRTTGDPFAIHGQGGEDSRTLAIQRYQDLEQEINRDVDHYVDMINEAWSLLNQLENPEIALMLDDRYMRGMTVERTAKKAGYSVRQTYRMLQAGLQELGNLLAAQPPMMGYISPLPLGEGDGFLASDSSSCI